MYAYNNNKEKTMNLYSIERVSVGKWGINEDIEFMFTYKVFTTKVFLKFQYSMDKNDILSNVQRKEHILITASL